MIYAFVNPDPLLFDDPDSAAPPLATGVAHLLRDAELIPVTGRDELGLLEVPAAFTSWQVLLYGAVVLTPEGTEDDGWRRVTADIQTRHASAVGLAAQALAHISMFGQLDVQVELVERGGSPLLVRATHPHGLELALRQAAAEWQAWIDDGPFAAHLRLLHDGLTLVVLPRELGADGAVNHVMQAVSDLDLSVGVGARDADRTFLALCDLTIIPGNTAWLERTPTDLED
ncbi:hypothetical protein [Deinococcus rufus]|uniref:Uncharacterized protein n=1 Tax=Deinococcus rufus TaxID=2136097 RepID=A0ABV7ZCF3_9DEIO